MSLNNLPKGMSIPETNETPEQKPVFLTLASVNYAGMIREVLTDLPFEVQIIDCFVIEKADYAPEVRLKLTILGEKEIRYKVGRTE